MQPDCCNLRLSDCLLTQRFAQRFTISCVYPCFVAPWYPLVGWNLLRTSLDLFERLGLLNQKFEQTFRDSFLRHMCFDQPLRIVASRFRIPPQSSNSLFISLWMTTHLRHVDIFKFLIIDKVNLLMCINRPICVDVLCNNSSNCLVFWGSYVDEVCALNARISAKYQISSGRKIWNIPISSVDLHSSGRCPQRADKSLQRRLPN